MSLARAYEAAVREAAGWLPRTRVWQASLALPEPPPLRYRVRVGGVRRVCESRQSAWPRICLRCGTPGGQASLPLGVSTTAGDQLVLVATLPATRAYLQALAQELQRLGCPAAFSVRPVKETDGRGENRRIRAAKPWRNLRWLDCGGCTQAAAYLISRRSDLAFARVAGGVYVCRRWVPLAELAPDEWPMWRPDWVPDRPIPSADPPPPAEAVLWRLPGPQDEDWQPSDGADVPQGAVWLPTRGRDE